MATTTEHNRVTVVNLAAMTAIRVISPTAGAVVMLTEIADDERQPSEVHHQSGTDFVK